MKWRTCIADPWRKSRYRPPAAAWERYDEGIAFKWLTEDTPILSIERFARAVRHAPLFDRMEWLWNCIRPAYDRMLASKGALPRMINGTDPILVSPACRQLGEVYEPEVWTRFMQVIRPGDRIVDVGAHHGLYSVAAAKRLTSGRVFAFEPDPENYRILRTHVALNRLDKAITMEPVAVSAEDGRAGFRPSNEQSHLVIEDHEAVYQVRTLRLDSYFRGTGVDVLKIDVEGYEEWVLRGGAGLLSNPHTAPRAVFVELHPYAWEKAGTTSESLLACLADYDISFSPPDMGRPIDRYGHLFAYRRT